MDIVKISLDYHGVINKSPEFFSEFSKRIVQANQELHIVTGNPETPEIINELKAFGMQWTHFYSIQDDLINRGYIPVIKEEDNSKWFDRELWDSAKGIYCAKHEIHLHYDDSPEYGDYFTTPFMLI